MSPQVRCLLRKEWRQLLRSRAAMASALLLPLILLLIVPGLQILALRHAPEQLNLPSNASLPPGLANLKQDPTAIMRFMLPLMMTMGGLIVPSLMAVYTLISERESRTLELLIALPVRVEQVLAAKLLVIFFLSAGVTGAFCAVDAALILGFRLASPAFVLQLLLLLFSALAYSIASALLISLLARDFRTANNVNGALLVPCLFLAVGVLLGLPDTPARLLLLAGGLLLAAGTSTWVALRVVTFERLLR